MPDEVPEPAAARRPAARPPAVAVPPVSAPPVIAPPPLPHIPGFEVVRRLGAPSGMGDVYGATDVNLGRPVAIKVLKASVDGDEARERFFREARVLAALSDHPNIVNIHALGLTPAGRPYLVMAFVHGRTLDDWLWDRWRPPEGSAIAVAAAAAVAAGVGGGSPPAAPDADAPIRLLAKVCAAVGAAHDAGIIHRDLKPANVMVDRRGEPQLLDFGIAQLLAGVAMPGSASTLSPAGGLPCTPVYASPEQASFRRDRMSPASDVYSLGVILYQMVTGGLYPYREAVAAEEDAWVVLDVVRRCELVPPRERLAAARAAGLPPPPVPLPAIDGELEAVVLRALCREPADRYAHADALGSALTRWADRPRAAAVAVVARTPAPAVRPAAGVVAVGARPGVPAAGASPAVPVAGARPGVPVVVARPGVPAARAAPVPVAPARAVPGQAVPARATPVRPAAGVRPSPQPSPPPPARVLRNSVGVTLVRIEPGTFVMGSPLAEEGRIANETPHEVTLTRAFYLGATPVTQAQWKAVMGPDNDPSKFKGDALPVEWVSWDEAVDYCRLLGMREGKAYRLPTEAEWEYACRAGTATPFHTGPTIGPELANYDANYGYGPGGAKGVSRKKTTPAGDFRPNAWGLYDMHGNVGEWCADWYGDYPPGAARDPQGPDRGKARVVRGGSWLNFPRACRSAFRSHEPPGGRYNRVGFRLALDAG